MLDILIIGSGPAGLSAAVYGKRASLDVLVAEKKYLGTGQIVESNQVDNYLGMIGISGYDLGESFRGHAEKLDVDFYEGEANRFEQTTDGWKTYFNDGDCIESKTVIYAAGAIHRKLGVEGEEQFLGKGVSYCAVCDGAFYKGKVTAVIGGGDTALDDALYLSELCKKVYLIHRRNQFRGSVKTLEKLKQLENVEIVTEAQVVKIEGEKKIASITLNTGRIILLDGIFCAVGMVPQTEVLQDVVALDANGYVRADETGKTSAKGFFAAGDVRTKQLRQVITAVSDGANAATEAAGYIAEQGR